MRVVFDPLTTVNDQFAVAKPADDWKAITSVTAVDDQFTVMTDQLAAGN